MGAVIGVPPPPAGSVVVVIESAESCSMEPCTGRKFDANLQQPPFVDIPTQAWQQFIDETARLVKTYKSEGLSNLLLLLAAVIFVGTHPLFPLGRDIIGIGTSLPILMVGTFGCIFGMILLRTSLRKQNMEVDRRITELCERISSPNFYITFQTMFTMPCKPKHARTVRARPTTSTRSRTPLPCSGCEHRDA